MVRFIKKRLQVFVSSTYLDLKDERQAAVKAILEVNHIPAGMELFTSGDESQMEVIKQWIEDSDVYLLILGGRYGSIEPNSGKSYTHLEYEYALHLKKPVFACVITDTYLNSKIQGGCNYKDIMEQDNIEKFKEFKKIVMSNVISQCSDIAKIKYEIVRKMTELYSDDKLTGWIRASDVSDDIATLNKENSTLRSQIEKISRQGVQTHLTINGVSFDEVIRTLNELCLTEEDLLETKNIPYGYPVDDSNNGFLIKALEKIREGNIKTVLDLLILFSNDFAEKTMRSGEVSLARITLVSKMEVVFNADILEYCNTGNLMFKSPRFTTDGQLLIKYARMPRNKI